MTESKINGLPPAKRWTIGQRLAYHTARTLGETEEVAAFTAGIVGSITGTGGHAEVMIGDLDGTGQVSQIRYRPPKKRR